MIKLAYTEGLRVSELVAVKVQHLNLKKMKVFVPGKGNLGTLEIIFSMELKDAFQKQVGNKGPDDYLFPSERRRDFATRSVTKFFKAVLANFGN